MVRKVEINTLIGSKFDELKNQFVNESKLFIKEMKDEMKKLLAEEFEKSKLTPIKRWKS